MYAVLESRHDTCPNLVSLDLGKANVDTSFFYETNKAVGIPFDIHAMFRSIKTGTLTK